MKFITSCIQTNSGSDVVANIATIGPRVAQAAKAGARLVSLPENAFHMRAGGGVESPRFEESNHPGIAAAKEWAAQHHVWILVGSVAVAVEDPKETRRYNRSLLIDPQGNITARYDKIHLFDVEVGDGQSYCESATILPGDKAVVADVEGVKLGLSICYDLRFPHLYRTLAKAGAQVMMVPAAFTQVTGEAHWHTLLRARAIENGCFVVAAAQCGEHPGGRKTFGHSLIIDPWGKVLADGGTTPGMITMELELDQVAYVRGKLPSLMHDRAFS